jgi:hypothetical protein
MTTGHLQRLEAESIYIMYGGRVRQAAVLSYGFHRMLNADIADLYQGVSAGATVVVSR